jgi:hypothetical protein
VGVKEKEKETLVGVYNLQEKLRAGHNLEYTVTQPNKRNLFKTTRDSKPKTPRTMRDNNLRGKGGMVGASRWAGR